jgi:hypothetical protein
MGPKKPHPLDDVASPEAHQRAGSPPVPKVLPTLSQPGQAPEHRDNPRHPHERPLPGGGDSRDPQVSRVQVDGLPKGTPVVGIPPKKAVVRDETAGKRPIPPWLA